MRDEQEVEVQIMPRAEDGATLARVAKSEIEAVVETAHKYPRSVTRFLAEAESSATVDEETAASCEYARPGFGGGDPIKGPSIRLAEIVAASYGNLYTRVEVVDIGDRSVRVRGIAWDVEKNQRVEQEVSRSIVNKKGIRFADHLIQTTIAAASSIALRNAIFRVIPRSFVNRILAKAREVARGDVKTLGARRDAAFVFLKSKGVTKERVLAVLGREGLEDVTLDDLVHLTHLKNSVSEGASWGEVFPEIPADITTAAPAEPKPTTKAATTRIDKATEALRSEPKSAPPAKAPEAEPEKPAVQPAPTPEREPGDDSDAPPEAAGAPETPEEAPVREAVRNVRRRMEACLRLLTEKGLVAADATPVNALAAFVRARKIPFDLAAAYPKIAAGTLTDGEAIECGAAFARVAELLEKVRPASRPA